MSGEKKIESRWYKYRRDPWNKIKLGEKVYFKDAGKPVTAMAEVERVEQFTVLEKAAKVFGDKSWMRGKNYCVLIWLKNPKRIEPFRINKAGFGSAVAWLCMENINKIRVQ